MNNKLVKLTYEIEVKQGKKLTLPESLTNNLEPGRWLITITPITQESNPTMIRNHNAFLQGYAPEDEGLYDDY